MHSGIGPKNHLQEMGVSFSKSFFMGIFTREKNTHENIRPIMLGIFNI